MTRRTAECSCGQLQLTVDDEPVRISICHCHACQRRTGSVFGTQAWFARERVSIAGEARLYRRVADSGNAASFHFCPFCGSTVYYEPDVKPHLVGVPVGAFADATFPAPKVSVYEERMHPWVRVPDDVEHSW